MKDFLKRYKVRLEILTPMFIGSGQGFTKKEYIFYSRNENKTVWIPNVNKMFKDICARNLIDEYENFMLSGKITLLKWMKTMGYKDTEIQKLCAYHMDCKEALKWLERPIEIQTFMKDPYGLPYIPGSSLKGAIRTVLLAKDILDHPQKYQEMKEAVENAPTHIDGKPNWKYLFQEGRDVPIEAFYTLEKNKDLKHHPLNDVLKGIIIGDSKPLSYKDLILCQKIDVAVDGKMSALNILRECLKPGTVVEFDLTIDTSVCNITAEDINEALSMFCGFYRNIFVEKFIEIEEEDQTNLYFGGGCGFGTKSVMYELLDDSNRLEIVARMMELKFRKHGHEKDVEIGISPHVLKCTYYNEKIYEMGKCNLKLEEL